MKILTHHIYEYQKGLRNLVMHTLPACLQVQVTGKLDRYGIDFHIHGGGKDKIIVFFGSPASVAVVRHLIRGRKFCELTPEEDFVLGSMLGYDIGKQCERYLKKLTPLAVFPEQKGTGTSG